jgi:asparagine synthase (glutamine-hydrolysing)
VCGIAGSLGEQPDATEHTRIQLRTLEHRGPDAFGIHSGSCAAVGQTRLSIIDLVAGDPPIVNDDATIGVAHNGEIYNFEVLRDELRRRGCRLKTEGDTEVIAHLAEDHEPVALARRLHGMFAFAVWDERRRRLVLGRDRVGKKPLYYWSDGRQFVFGSEIKAVLAHPAVPRELDPDAIPAYLTFGYVPTPKTFFAGIRSVPPGHVLTVEADGAMRLEQYWDYAVPGVDGAAGTLDVSLAEAADLVRASLTDAVTRRLISDVPLGAFLSGGIDSSTVVALMSMASSQPVNTFSIGFEDETGFDERPFARMVAERYGTNHVEFVVQPDAAGLVERLVWHHDQPFGDSSALPTYILSELTKRHVTVALCGDGGDELFGGYERFAAALAMRRFDALPGPLRTRVAGAVDRLPAGALGGRVGSVQRMLGRTGLPTPQAFLSWISYVGEPERRALLPDADGWAVDEYIATWNRSSGATLLNRLLDLNLRTYLLDDLLPKVDRMAMAHGLEVRAPFLDSNLIDLALRLPDHTRIRGLALKRALRLVAADLLPDAVVHRPKRGFGVPLDRWFRTDLRPLLEGKVGAPGSRVRRHLRGDGIDRVLGEHFAGRAHGQALWTLLTLELFLEREGW